MSEKPLNRIRRGNEELGAWDRYALRQFIAAGSILPSDEVFVEEDGGRWIPLLPPYRRKYNFFDWTDEGDLPWYYIKDGAIFGPRHIDEIGALCETGQLAPDGFVAHIGADKWITVGELLSAVPADEPDAADHANVSIQKWTQGDFVGAGVEGAKAIGKFWQKFTEPAPITTERLYVPLGEGRPSPTSVLSFIELEGISFSEQNEIPAKGGFFLELVFDSVESAIAARDALNFKKVDGMNLQLWDRQEIQLK